MSGQPVMSAPSKRMRPLRGVSNPVMARSVVDLPAPLAPMSVTTHARRHAATTSRRAWMPP
jgi:hypothetical protein